MPRRPVSKAIHSTTTALVLYKDVHKLRTKYIKAYKTALSSLQKESKRLQNYHEHDSPNFRTWFTVQFSQKMESMQRLFGELNQLEQLFNLADHYAYIHDVSINAACRAIQKAKENNELEQLQASLRQAENDSKDEQSKEFDEILRDVFGMDSELEEEEDDDRHDGDRARDFYAADAANQSTRKLVNEQTKGLYRQLSKLLHPDLCENPSAENLELWHQVQNAYEWNDAATLEVILAKLQGPPQKSVLDLSIISLGQLSDMKKVIQQNLNKIRRTLRPLKQNPDWDFVEIKRVPRQLNQLHARIYRDLDMDENSMHFKLNSLKSEWQRLTRPVQAKKPKATKKKTRRHNPFDELFDLWSH